jgi:hypothetical protein
LSARLDALTSRFAAGSTPPRGATAPRKEVMRIEEIALTIALLALIHRMTH